MMRHEARTALLALLLMSTISLFTLSQEALLNHVIPHFKNRESTRHVSLSPNAAVDQIGEVNASVHPDRNRTETIIMGTTTTQDALNRRKIQRSPTARPFIALDAIFHHDNRSDSCGNDMFPAFNNPMPTFNQTSTHKIPLIIHQTAPSHCLSQAFYTLHRRWQVLGIPYYLHTDKQVEDLVMSTATYEEFPHLQTIWQLCSLKPVVKTDIWRLVSVAHCVSSTY